MSADPDKIEGAIALLTPPENWTQLTYAREPDGYPNGDPLSEHVTCWCLAGAMKRSGCDVPELQAVLAVIRDRFPKFTNIPTFNDHQHRTHDEVLAVLRTAKRNAQMGIAE